MGHLEISTHLLPSPASLPRKLAQTYLCLHTLQDFSRGVSFAVRSHLLDPKDAFYTFLLNYFLESVITISKTGVLARWRWFVYTMYSIIFMDLFLASLKRSH